MLIRDMPQHMQARALVMYSTHHSTKDRVIGKKEFPFNLNEGKFKTIAIDDAPNAVRLGNIVLLKSDLDAIHQLLDVLDFKYEGHKIIFVEKWEGDCINEKLGDFTKDLPALVSTPAKWLHIKDITLVFGFIPYHNFEDVLTELSCQGPTQELEAAFISNIGKHLASDYDDKLLRIRRNLTKVDEERHRLSNSYASLNTVLKIFNLNKEGYFRQIIEDIRSLPNVESTRLYSANGILITTTELSTDDLLSNGNKFVSKYVGVYEIRFNFKTGGIHARNIAAPSNQFQILYQGLNNPEDISGYTCMGSFLSLLSNALQSCDYAKTINYTIEYLRSFDPDDGNAKDAYKSLKMEKPEKLHRFPDWVTIAGE